MSEVGAYKRYMLVVIKDVRVLLALPSRIISE